VAQITDQNGNFTKTCTRVVFIRSYAHRQRQPKDYVMSKGTFAVLTAMRSLLPILLAVFVIGTANAQENSGDQLRSLDGQVQEIKTDVLGIASDLSNLEERLLYPSNTETAVFVSIAQNEKFRLDAVKIEIDGNLATHHIYSFKELEALQEGGVQRAYTGNIVTGNHELRITMIGKLENGKDFTESSSFAFSKDVRPETLGVTLSAPGLTGNGINIGEW
jgi:hypothetical protein